MITALFFRNNAHKQAGLTLLELLLYVSLASIALLVFFSMYQLVIQSRQKSYNLVEVNWQGVQIIQHVTQTLRSATSVNLLPSSSDDEITIIDNNTDSVRFYYEDGQLWEQVNNNDPLPLTNNLIQMTDLEFHNVSRGSAPSSINLEFTLVSVGNTDSAYHYSQAFTAAASLRQ